jgi:hypothetical protein
MKKFLSISSVVIVNLVLGYVFWRLFNPFDLTFTEFFTRRVEYWFSPNPVYNILMVGSLIGLVTFDLKLFLTRKK